MVMFLSDALRNGWQVNHEVLRRQIAAQGRFALMERETALVTLGGDDYQEPPDWDWDALLAAVERDRVLEDLERAFDDEED